VPFLGLCLGGEKTMNSKRLVGIAILILVFIVGCLEDYGLVKRQTPTDNKMTLAELRENWEDYHVYYGKWGGMYPYKILFDPKNDEIRLVGDGWYKIEDQQTLSETVSETQTQWGSHEVMIIEAPDRQFLGYMYCSWGSGAHGYASFTPSGYEVKLIDEHTVYVRGGI
jgi:hypothetical protein